MCQRRVLMSTALASLSYPSEVKENRTVALACGYLTERISQLSSHQTWSVATDVLGNKKHKMTKVQVTGSSSMNPYLVQQRCSRGHTHVEDGTSQGPLYQLPDLAQPQHSCAGWHMPRGGGGGPLSN